MRCPFLPEQPELTEALLFRRKSARGKTEKMQKNQDWRAPAAGGICQQRAFIAAIVPLAARAKGERRQPTIPDETQ
jgi:hypothetical protein